MGKLMWRYEFVVYCVGIKRTARMTVRDIQALGIYLSVLDVSIYFYNLLTTANIPICKPWLKGTIGLVRIPRYAINKLYQLAEISARFSCTRP